MGSITTRRRPSGPKRDRCTSESIRLSPSCLQGDPIGIHLRLDGTKGRDTVSVQTTLCRLLRSPGAWRNGLLSTSDLIPQKNRVDFPKNIGFDFLKIIT